MIVNLLEKAQKLAHGAATLAEWIGDGGHTVDRELAQGRADICLKCPKHNNNFSWAEPVANAIKRQMELKNHLMLRVNGERQLHVCGVCECPMRLKIWLPLRRVLPELHEINDYDPSCWLLNETP